MNDCVFYLKKDAVLCLYASNRWSERVLRSFSVRLVLSI